MRRSPSRAARGAATAMLAAGAIALSACGGSGAGGDAPGTAAGAPAAAPRPTQSPPASAASTPAPPPSPASAAEGAATAGPRPSRPERPPKPATAARAERDAGPGEPETRSGKPAETPGGAKPAAGDAEGSGAVRSPGGQEYTWHDGDRVRSVTLEPALVVQPSSENTATDVVARDDGRTSIVERQPRHAARQTGPVFRSQSGQLMTLPGGVLLVLDDGWDDARVKRFLSDNAIPRSVVEKRDWAVNAFFIETGPGFPSLTLANALAVLEGVVISSPNWQTDVSPR